ATALTDDALEPDALVLAAVALPVAGGTEDLLAEEPVLLRLEGAVVDRLGLLDLAVRPLPDVVGGSQADAQLVKEVDVEHVYVLLVRRCCGGVFPGHLGHSGRSGLTPPCPSRPRKPSVVTLVVLLAVRLPRLSWAHASTGRCPALRRRGR